MKRLNTNGNTVLLHLAEHALFERIQDLFDLYPGKIARDIRGANRSTGESCENIIQRLRELVPLEFDYVLGQILDFLEGKPADFEIGSRLYASVIRKRFKLDPKWMMREYPSKAKAIGLDPSAIVWAHRETVPTVIKWMLDEVEKILRKDGAIK